ncbi:hypothetical protein EVB78_127 [Rhizobium phage RHph_N1_15]|nr:hypothetical protein EVB77_127 [Rhizobium phage RHph_N1_10]QIG69329.1 hypothetical protein EVB78_127 [Rhizobium phage RHph_N1_15]QIG75189.1 hypothetical protein EVC15_127 [Rhizobium phage RHph_N2_6]
MAWGARQEDGVWRLCERRGRTITHVTRKVTPAVEIRFPGRAASEKCAHEMNERFWDGYSRDKRSHTQDWEIVHLIAAHQGISPADLQRLKEEWK